MAKGRKIEKHISPGEKFSVTIPNEFTQKDLELIKELVMKEGTINGALLFFIRLGIDTYLWQQSTEQVTLSLKGIPENQQDNLKEWLQQKPTQRFISRLLLHVLGDDTLSELNEDQDLKDTDSGIQELQQDDIWISNLIKSSFGSE